MTTKYTYEEMCDYLFENFAPNFNFEKDGEQLLHIALDRGFVKRKYEGDEAYFVINEEY